MRKNSHLEQNVCISRIWEELPKFDQNSSISTTKNNMLGLMERGTCIMAKFIHFDESRLYISAQDLLSISQLESS